MTTTMTMTHAFGTVQPITMREGMRIVGGGSNSYTRLEAFSFHFLDAISSLVISDDEISAIGAAGEQLQAADTDAATATAIAAATTAATTTAAATTAAAATAAATTANQHPYQHQHQQ